MLFESICRISIREKNDICVFQMRIGVWDFYNAFKVQI